MNSGVASVLSPSGSQKPTAGLSCEASVLRPAWSEISDVVHAGCSSPYDFVCSRSVATLRSTADSEDFEAKVKQAKQEGKEPPQ